MKRVLLLLVLLVPAGARAMLAAPLIAGSDLRTRQPLAAEVPPHDVLMLRLERLAAEGGRSGEAR